MQAYIDYLNEIKADNNTTIAANTATIAGINEVNANYTANIAANNVEITNREDNNTQLAADNTLIDSLIALLESQ